MAKRKVTGEDGKTYVMKEKKPFYKKVWFWALIVFVLIAIGGGALGGDENDEAAKKVDAKDKTEQSTKSSTKNSKKETAPKEFKVGDTVDIKGYQIKVNGVTYSDSEGYSTPEEGKQFVIINLTITNATKEKESFNPLDFSLNEDGVSSSTGFTYVDGIETLNSGDLDAGASVTGNLVGEAKPDSKLKLRYEGNIFLKDQEVDITIR